MGWYKKGVRPIFLHFYKSTLSLLSFFSVLSVLSHLLLRWEGWSEVVTARWPTTVGGGAAARTTSFLLFFLFFDFFSLPLLDSDLKKFKDTPKAPGSKTKYGKKINYLLFVLFRIQRCIVLVWHSRFVLFDSDSASICVAIWYGRSARFDGSNSLYVRLW